MSIAVFYAVWKHLLLQLSIASTVLLQAISWHGFTVQATD